MKQIEQEAERLAIEMFNSSKWAWADLRSATCEPLVPIVAERLAEMARWMREQAALELVHWEGAIPLTGVEAARLILEIGEEEVE